MLIVGPGLDLAPRTGLLEAARRKAISHGRSWTRSSRSASSRLDDLEVVGADINPRVVAHLRRAHEHAAGADARQRDRATATRVTLSPDYRDYFAALGRPSPSRDAPPAPRTPVQGAPAQAPSASARPPPARSRPSRSTSSPSASTGEPFDLIVATNILPYFDDGELMLAMSNIAAMLAPGGVFLHNEAAAGRSAT